TALMPASAPGAANRVSFHAPPSECSRWPPFEVTAQASDGEIAATPTSAGPLVGTLGVGLGTVDHKGPHFAEDAAAGPGPTATIRAPRVASAMSPERSLRLGQVENGENLEADMAARG